VVVIIVNKKKLAQKVYLELLKKPEKAILGQK